MAKHKLFLSLVILASLSACASAPAPRQPASALQGIFGDYRGDHGELIRLLKTRGTAKLETRANLTRDDNCESNIGKVERVNDGDDYAEITFAFDAGNCAWFSGDLVFHYNRAITGVDVYLIDIPSSHGKVRWSLDRL